MSTILRAPSAARAFDRPSFVQSLAVALRRCWAAYTRWRAEQAGIARLHAMSDRQLRDIGLVRSQIEFAVRGEAGRDRQGPTT